MASSEKTEVNYLYFCFFFLFVFALTFSHFIHASQPFWGIPLLFLFYAGAQALLEVFILILVGKLLHRWMPRWTFRFYIALSFGFLLIHFANFTLIRIMDVSLSYCVKVFFGRGFEHFRIACQATNVNPMMTAVIVGSLIVVPLVGLLFYRATHKISCKIPLKLSYWTCGGIIGVLSVILFAFDLLAKPYVTSDVHKKYSKALPFALTFLSPEPRLISIDAPLCEPRKEIEIQKVLKEDSLKAASLPNIYLFVIETLRRDYIDEKTAPNMTQFGEENIDPKLTFSNANFTYLSWFSLFHSSYPYGWTAVRDGWKEGSVPLQMMKKLGYNIRIYSSADLNYFGMDRNIFGANRQLIGTIHEYNSLRLEPWERDLLAINDLIKDVAESSKEGNLFITFLDSTHSEYSSPEKGFRPFQPVVSSIDYLGIATSSKDLELLKNCYRNSIFWVDHLVGRVFSSLKELSLYKESVIVLTGDHGEEFFEMGALFHGTHLNDWQTRVPLFYKFPKDVKNFSSVSTHIDVFPSILHYLTGRSDFRSYFDGQSIFSSDQKGFVFSMQHNGVDIPYEFRIFDGNAELVGRFLNPPNIYSVPAIELLSFRSLDGNEQIEEGMLQERFKSAFDPLIQKIPVAKASPTGEAFSEKRISNLLEAEESKKACETL